jgi:hypothetical protein
VWGLHLLDANIALGNLITIVDDEAAAYVRAGGRALAPARSFTG